MSIETEYKLIFDGLYKWSRSGKVAEALNGSFLRRKDALRAFELHELSKEPPISSVKKEVDLESLNSKIDLLKWAEVNGLSVPAKYKQPSAIKKFLMSEHKD
tara:strand:+ start:11808 stop:12113 length:306 start_codon:yes stop_codon:yes gene_type:complete